MMLLVNLSPWLRYWISDLLSSAMVDKQKTKHMTSIRCQFSGSATVRICCTNCRPIDCTYSKLGVAFALPIL